MTALRRGFAFACIATLSFVFAMSLSAESAFAQEDNAEGAADSSAMLTQGVDEATVVDAEAAIPAGSAESLSTVSVDAVSATEGSTGELVTEGTEEPTDQFEARIVVGEDQQREFDGTALRNDEYYVAVTFEGSDEVVRYYASDAEDVGAFAFFTEAGDPLDQPPTNAGIYQIQAQLLATDRHVGRTLKDTFEITKRAVSVPALPINLAYTGQEQQAIAETDLYTVKGGSATEVGEYTARLTLRDPDNYFFPDGEIKNGRHLGFLDIAWAIDEADVSQAGPRPDYQWEVTPADDPDLTFGSVTVRRASSPLFAKILTVRDNSINFLSGALLNFVKFMRILFPGLKM